MILQILLTLLLLLGCVLQLAVKRAPELRDNDSNLPSRRVLIAGMFVLMLWLAYLTIEGQHLDPVPIIGIALMVLAEIMFCVTLLLEGPWPKPGLRSQGSAAPRRKDGR